MSDRSRAQRFVVAGADGYIGSNVYRRLCAVAGISVLPLSRRPAGAGAIDLVKSPQLLLSMLREFRPDVVINCAGTTAPDLRACIDSHVIATANLLEALAVAAPGSRLVQLGSAAEYGQAVAAPLLIDENTPAVPLGVYGVSKLASTLLAVTHAPALNLECIALRIFNLIGPDMLPGTIVPNVLRFLAAPGRHAADPIDLGKIDVYRDFVHVNDVVAAIIAAAHAAPAAVGSIINIASGEPVMVRMLVRGLLDAAGHHGEIREVACGSGRSTGVTWQQADISRARKLLGWAPVKSLSDSILELVATDAARKS